MWLSLGFLPILKGGCKSNIQERNTNGNGLKNKILSMTCKMTSTEVYSTFVELKDKLWFQR